MTLDTTFSHGVHPQTSDAPHLCACPLWLAWTEPEGREPAELAEPAGGGEGRTSCPNTATCSEHTAATTDTQC